ncbi:hypothetical protein PF011_g11758 [Phytophthora fragariae]|uniref:Mixed lineage kinase domain-containing protein n=1 Tax=Phytophthora fragariae TaxID=53985 RepID=A0A6A3KRJ8_9STRA|nr:hypothetical protein PF011_g11758 [Phytophthora fragariae]
MGFVDDLVVPGSGPVVQVLSWIEQLCTGMNENQASCERLHRRLTYILDALQTMEGKSQLPASSSLDKYVGLVVKFLDYLKRYRGKKLAFRIIKQQQMQSEIQEIHRHIDLFLGELNLAKSTDWRQQSEGDQRLQHKLLMSMTQNSIAIKRELQQTRSQLEAMLTLQFEAAQEGRHGSGTVVRVLAKISQLCLKTKEDQEACRRLHRRLQDIFDELEKLEKKKGLPSSDALEMYVKVLAKTLLHLKRYKGKNLIARLIEHQTMMQKLRDINEEVDMVVNLLNLTESTRAQLEAMTMLKFEIETEHRRDQQNDRVMELLQSEMTTVDQQSIVIMDAELPPWFIPSDEIEFERQPFARGAYTSLHHDQPSDFSQLYALQCLKWCMTADSMLTNPEFDGIRMSIPRATGMYLAHFVVDLEIGSDLEKEKAVVLCACFATRGDIDPLYAFRMVQPLVALLRGNDTQKVWAAEALGNLAAESDTIRAQIMQGDTIASLVALILVGTEDQKHRAAYALRNLALSKDASELIVRRGVIGPLVGLAHTGTRQQKTAAESALENLVRMTYANPADIALEESTDPLIAVVLVGSPEQKDSAASALMAIARTNDALRADIERDGGVSLFIALLRSGTDEEKNHAACALRDLAVRDAARVEIVREGGIALLVELLKSGTGQQNQSAAHALLAITKLNEAARVDTVIEEGIKPLISLVRDGTAQQKSYAAGVLANIARSKEPFHADIVSAGGITPLVELLRSGTTEQKNFAVSALGNLLTRSNDATRAEIAYEGGFTLLTALVRAGLEHHKENAACALMVLARSNEDVRADIARKGGVRLLISLIRTGTDQQKAYAVSALGDLAFNDLIRDEVALEGAIPLLMSLLRAGSDQVKKNVVCTLGKLANNDNIYRDVTSGLEHFIGFLQQTDYESRAIDEHARTNDEERCITILISLLRYEIDRQKVFAVNALGDLGASSSTRAMMARGGAIPPLITLLRVGTDKQKESSLCSLDRLAADDEICREIEREEGVDSLVSLLRAGTDQQKVYAASLFKTLCKANDELRAKLSLEGSVEGHNNRQTRAR